MKKSADFMTNDFEITPAHIVVGNNIVTSRIKTAQKDNRRDTFKENSLDGDKKVEYSNSEIVGKGNLFGV